MSRSADGRKPSSVRFPRVSGDEPGREIARAYSDEFSPRERG